MLIQLFSYCQDQSFVFNDETMVRISSEGIVRVLPRIGMRFEKKMSSDKRSFMFRCAIRSDGRKMLVRCPSKLYAADYLCILKHYEEKEHFQDIIFQ